MAPDCFGGAIFKLSKHLQFGVSWWGGVSFHANLRNSNGLKPQPRKRYIKIDEAPDRVREVYDRVMPHYEFMHQ